jgi:hypothetical protein
MRALLVAAFLLSGASFGTSQESPRDASEQADKAKTDQKPTSAFEQTGNPVPFWFAPQPQTIQIVSEKKTESACESPEHYTPWELIAITWCGLRTYPEALTALGTIILAFGTFILAVSTHTAARAAKVAAEHIPIVEGAYIYVLIPDDYITDRINWIGEGAVGVDPPSVDIFLKNFGKTPAFVHRMIARLSCPPVNIGEWGRYFVPPGIILAADQTTIYSEMVRLTELSPAEAAMVKKQIAQIILEGTIVYADIWGVEWSAKFNGRYDPNSSRFSEPRTTLQNKIKPNRPVAANVVVCFYLCQVRDNRPRKEEGEQRAISSRPLPACRAGAS